MSDNQEAIYYAAHSSNHVAQAQPEMELMASYIPEAAKGARRLMNQFLSGQLVCNSVSLCLLSCLCVCLSLSLCLCLCSCLCLSVSLRVSLSLSLSPSHTLLIDWSRYGKSCIDEDPGLTFPSHLAPYGLSAAIGPSPDGDQRIRWNGELAMSVLLWDWEYTHNTSRLQQYTWPLLTGFAKKWRCWLVRVPSIGAPDGFLLVNYHGKSTARRDLF